MISYLGWKMFQLLTYIKIECKKNQSLVQCLDLLTIKKCMQSRKDRNWVLTFWPWSSYYFLMMNRL